MAPSPGDGGSSGGDSSGGGEPAPPELTQAQVAWRLAPLFFTHILLAVHTTLPFTIAVYMVREWWGGEAADEAAVGRATGMLSAMFCFTQLLTSYPWGLAADRWGRVPLLVVGNASSALGVVAFGVSGSYGQAMAARAVSGALNALILAEKAYIGEGLPHRNDQAKAFSLMSLCWGLGSLAGPLMGGALSTPCASALRVEALCGPGSLLVVRPYSLPCLVVGALTVVATAWVAWGLEETLPSRRPQRYAALAAADDGAPSPPPSAELELQSSAGSSELGKLAAFRGDSARQLSPGRGGGPAPLKGSKLRLHSPDRGGSPSSSSGGMDDTGGKGAVEEDECVVLGPQDLEAAAAPAAADGAPLPPTPWHRQRLVLQSLAGYGLIAWLFNLLDELIPLFASAPVPDGGLGFTPIQLAPSISFGGAVLIAWSLFGFPFVMRRLGVLRVLRLGLWQIVPTAFAIPACSLAFGTLAGRQVGMFAVSASKAFAGTNAFTACLILVNVAAPKDQLGAVNGAGQAIASAVRALGPALGGLSWAWSLQLAHQSWWPRVPHQLLPFALSGVIAVFTDLLIYRTMQLPEGA